jgi:hypothetical protein
MFTVCASVIISSSYTSLVFTPHHHVVTAILISLIFIFHFTFLVSYECYHYYISKCDVIINIPLYNIVPNII